MRTCAAFAALLMLTIGLPACGKYGPPVRTVIPKEARSAPQATEAEPQVPGEKIPGPVDFDDAQDDEELIP
jgi:predicted small lipoprotein YifL